MMRRRGCGSTIAFGVRKRVDGAPVFHAWLAHDGHVITGGEHVEPFSVIAAYRDDRAGDSSSAA